MSYNPEKRAWRGRSYKKGGASLADLRDLVKRMADKIGEDSLSDEGFHDLYEEAQELLSEEEDEEQLPGHIHVNGTCNRRRPDETPQQREARLDAFERDRMPSKKRTPTRLSKTPGKSRWTCCLCGLNHSEEEMQLVRGTGELDFDEPDWVCWVCLKDCKEEHRSYCPACWNEFPPEQKRRRFHLLTTPCIIEQKRRVLARRKGT